jgi:hypothetical protein
MGEKIGRKAAHKRLVKLTLRVNFAKKRQIFLSHALKSNICLYFLLNLKEKIMSENKQVNKIS